MKVSVSAAWALMGQTVGAGDGREWNTDCVLPSFGSERRSGCHIVRLFNVMAMTIGAFGEDFTRYRARALVALGGHHPGTRLARCHRCSSCTP